MHQNPWTVHTGRFYIMALRCSLQDWHYIVPVRFWFWSLKKKRVELGWAFFQLFLKCSESFELSLQNQFQVCRRLQERSVDPKIHLWFGFRVFRPCFCLRMPFHENKYHKLSCYAMYKWTRCLTVEDMGGFVSALTSLLLYQSSCQSFLVVSRDYRQDTPGCCLSIWRETAWIYSPILPKWVSLSTVYFVSNLSGHYFIYTHQNQPTANDIMTASSSHSHNTQLHNKMVKVILKWE